jgi:hypothetical protein
MVKTRKKWSAAMAKVSKARALRATLYASLNAFVRKVFSALAPGQTFVRSWHLEAIAHQLERLRRGEIGG